MALPQLKNFLGGTRGPILKTIKEPKAESDEIVAPTSCHLSNTFATRPPFCVCPTCRPFAARCPPFCALPCYSHRCPSFFRAPSSPDHLLSTFFVPCPPSPPDPRSLRQAADERDASSRRQVLIQRSLARHQLF